MKHLTGTLTQDDQVLGRFAPTPSGYLHIGNGVNLVLTWLKLRKQNGKILLRIDDMDATRSRPEFIEDIFQSLDWLGLDFDFGPSGPDEFKQKWSQQKRVEFYRSALTEIQNITYGCNCSRKKIKEDSPAGTYPGTCRDLNHKFKKDETALRIRTPKDIIMGDFVIWRKDDLPSYQLVSVLDDWDYGVNEIVRGLDLLESTQAQTFLAEKYKLESYLKANVFHHELILSDGGEKLSKSSGDTSLLSHRENGDSPTFIYKMAGNILGLPVENIKSLEDLL